MTTCPFEYAGPILAVQDFAERFDKGMPLIAGGQLDHTQWFIDAAAFVRDEMDYWKHRLNNPENLLEGK